MNEKNTRLVTAEICPRRSSRQVLRSGGGRHSGRASPAGSQCPRRRGSLRYGGKPQKIVVGGEITSKAEVDGGRIVADVINRIGYTMSDLCENAHDLLELEVCLHEQSPDISAAVGKTELGAGEALRRQAMRVFWWAMPPTKRKNTCPCPWCWHIASAEGWTN